MGNARARLGQIGEDLAVRDLERRGYAILARRYRRRTGEIDIVAIDGATVVFVEVKAREGQAYGGGFAAVTAQKRQRLVATARDFLARRGWHDRPCRFDVVAVDFVNEAAQIAVIRNAFDATG